MRGYGRSRGGLRPVLGILAVSIVTGCGSAPPTAPSVEPTPKLTLHPTPSAAASAKASPAATPSGGLVVTLDPDEMDDRYADMLPLFEYDTDAPLDIRVDSSREGAGIVLDSITYASSTGQTVPAVVASPREPAGLPGVIWLGPGGPVVERAEALAKLGVIVITPTPPQARPSGVLALKFTDQDRYDVIELMVELRRAVDVLIARGADPNRIAFVGYSWGGAMGAALSGIEHRIGSFNLMFADGGMVEHLLESPDREFGASLGGPARERWLTAMEPLESLYFVRHAAPSKLLFQNGLRDEAIARVSADRLHEMASDPKEVRWYDSGHDPTPDAPEVWCDQAAWLKEQLELSSSAVVECSQV